MAPTIVDGDAVLLIRRGTTMELGDVVIYDPTPRSRLIGERSVDVVPDNGQGVDESRPSGAPHANEALRNASLNAGGTSHEPGTEAPWSDGVFTRALHDVEDGVRLAVVDTDELEGTWAKVQRRSGVGRPPPRGFRIGRVLARPGDRVAFRVPGVPLGLEVNGAVLVQVPDDPVRLQLAGDDAPLMRAQVREALVPLEGALADEGVDALGSALSKPWSILPGAPLAKIAPGDANPAHATKVGAAAWAGMDLPLDDTPVELVAPGYLVLADHRDEGACCDSRTLGFLPPQALRGEVVARITGDARRAPQPATGEGAHPPRRGPAWLR